MLVDITEEEREFLERACVRQEMFAMRGLSQRPFEKNRHKLKELIRKLERKDESF